MRMLRRFILIASCSLGFAASLAGLHEFSWSQEAAGAVAERQTPPRVILFSWDGAAYWMTSRLLSEGRLPNLQRLIREGAWSDGMITSFPSKTAAGHAVLWTGQYGHTNGITGNEVLLEPASEHSRLESRTGFFSDALKVEPIWVRTARAGLMTYTFHATQSYPFRKHLESLSPTERDNLHMLYGYTRVNVPAAVYSESETPTSSALGWAIPEATGEEAREFTFEVGDEAFWAVFFDDPFDPAHGCDTLGIVEDKQDTAFLALVKPGKSQTFSVPIETALIGKPLWYSLRLFELEPSASRFLIYRSSAEVIEVSSGAFPGAGQVGVEAFAGNGGSSIYHGGGFGQPIYEGGDGKAEDLYLETVAHLTHQLQQQVEPVLSKGVYELLAMYTPVPDEVAHAYAGYLDPAVSGYDQALAEKLWPVVARAFEAQDALLGWLMGYAARDGAHILLLADHGMAGTNRLFNVNVALEHTGLLALTPEREIDLSRTRALLLPLADASVAINTTDRKGGIVPVEEKEAVLQEVREALENLVDPETGKRIVKGFFESSQDGLLQPGGSTTGDLFLDLAPGYYFSSSTSTGELVTEIPPQGNHIFVPTRRDMLAVFAAWGPRIPEGVHFHRVRAIDVVPTVLEILGLPLCEGLPGDSLVPRETLLETRG